MTSFVAGVNSLASNGCGDDLMLVGRHHWADIGVCVVYATVIFLSPIFIVGLVTTITILYANDSSIARQLRRLATAQAQARSSRTNFLIYPLFIISCIYFWRLIFSHMKLVVWWCTLLARTEIKASRCVPKINRFVLPFPPLCGNRLALLPLDSILFASEPHRSSSSSLH